MTDRLQFLNEVAAHVRVLGPEAGVSQSRYRDGGSPKSSELINGIESGQMLVGGLPPQPSTFRGRLGRRLVGLVRRALFWYTPSIHAFQRSVAAAFQEQMEETAAVRNELSRRLSLIEKENLLLRGQLRGATEELKRKDDLNSRISTLESMLSDWDTFVSKEHVREVAADLKNDLTNLSGRIDRQLQDIGENLKKIETVDRLSLSTRAEMILVERRLCVLLDKARGAISSENIHSDPAGRPQLLSDVAYYDFESQFRGSEDEIKDRVKIYLPRFVEKGLGTPEMPIVDIGCGRGEWLDVLREQRLLAYGVDGNSSMIAACKEKGLAVEQQDGIQHLRNLPDSSVGAVTAFHFVEHLPFAALLSFIDEVLRVLKSGGLALFETPNPDNVLVGSNTFYIDPTHQRPLPSGLLKFVLQSRGFSSIEVLTLHPYPPDYHLDPSAGPAARVLNERLFGCQDYAVMARKV